MDGVIIAVVTVALIVLGAVWLNWQIKRQEQKDAQAAAVTVADAPATERKQAA